MREAPARVGWCPGVLRPMAAGDGLLARVKPRGNRLTTAQACGVADVARRFGNGVLTLTSRANLQLRGFDEVTFADAVAALDTLGLLDADAAGEAARNVVSSPLAGSPEAPADLQPAVAALEGALIRDPVFRRLPAKFAWTVDDGGALDFSDVPSDVRFTATAGPAGPHLRIDIAPRGPAAICGLGGLVAAATSLAAAFLDLCGERGLVPHRLRDLVAIVGAEAVFARAALPLDDGAPAPRAPCERIGLLPHGAVAVAPAFGRLEAVDLDAFARAAALAGATDLRLTPWRSLIAAGLAEAGGLLDTAAGLGFIVDPADPRLAVVACAGQPACRRASAPVQAHAALLAPLLHPAPGGRTMLHLSGCSKGCAHAAPAPLTAVARDGLYDIVRGGVAGDRPAATGLPLAAVAAMLRAPGHRLGETV